MQGAQSTSHEHYPLADTVDKCFLTVGSAQQHAPYTQMLLDHTALSPWLTLSSQSYRDSIVRIDLDAPRMSVLVGSN